MAYYENCVGSGTAVKAQRVPPILAALPPTTLNGLMLLVVARRHNNGKKSRPGRTPPRPLYPHLPFPVSLSLSSPEVLFLLFPPITTRVSCYSNTWRQIACYSWPSSVPGRCMLPESAAAAGSLTECACVEPHCLL